MKRYNIDFYRRLETPIAGLVKRITSPKGVRVMENGKYVYRFKSELCGNYQGKPMRVVPGIYHVSCICKPRNRVIWNHYLYVVSADGKGYFVAEYLKQSDSEWIKDAIGIVKDYFAEIPVKPIKVKRFKKESAKATSWKLLKK